MNIRSTKVLPWVVLAFMSVASSAWAQLVQPQQNPRVKDNDFGVRNSNGFMFEVMRNLGFYLQFGETVGFVRWLQFEIDAGLGVQARIP